MVNPQYVEELTDELIETLKGLRTAKQSLPRLHPAVDQLTYPVLQSLADGPRRVGDLASAVGTEISTVSRQVTMLSNHGLLTKDTDPNDGRAQVLSLTAEGRKVLAQSRDRRNALFQQLLKDWSDNEVVHFTHHLRQLSIDLAASPDLASLDTADEVESGETE
ncbi:MarR family transcriptional regulator [Ornithinimicrobium sp. Arc0846-15]|nr:MarR family transcriptional regulator [Ornithinimicrobium laminariae]